MYNSNITDEPKTRYCREKLFRKSKTDQQIMVTDQSMPNASIVVPQTLVSSRLLSDPRVREDAIAYAIPFSTISCP